MCLCEAERDGYPEKERHARQQVLRGSRDGGKVRAGEAMAAQELSEGEPLSEKLARDERER